MKNGGWIMTFKLLSGEDDTVELGLEGFGVLESSEEYLFEE